MSVPTHSVFASEVSYTLFLVNLSTKDIVKETHCFLERNMYTLLENSYHSSISVVNHPFKREGGV